ncbi:MAG: hypothetical protein V9G12_02450 [Microthrixaceae bacterium]
MRGRALAALLVAAVVLAGCSSDEESSPPADTSSGLTTVPPSIVPLTTTTTIEGTPVSDAEIYAQVGLTVEQGACIAASGAEGDFESTPGPALTDAMVLAAETGAMVAIPATLRTSTELELTILTALAGDCAPADRLAALAAVDGQALDDAALADDLPVRLFHRTRDGATPAELACIEAKFREAPARSVVPGGQSPSRGVAMRPGGTARIVADHRARPRARGRRGHGHRTGLPGLAERGRRPGPAGSSRRRGGVRRHVERSAGRGHAVVLERRPIVRARGLNIVALGDDFGVEPLQPS